MKYHPVQLLCIIHLKFPGILMHALGADIDFSLELSSCFAQIEGDDICEGLMIKVVLIDPQQIIIIAKDER